MANLYQEYEKYRPELSDYEKEDLEAARVNEEELMADPNTKHWEHGWIDGDKKRLRYPVVEQEIRIGMDRASAQLMPWEKKGIIYPDDPGIVEKFPGIDPQGKFCEIDMSFAQRLAKVQAAIPSRSLKVQSYVGTVVRSLGDRSTEISKFWDQMKDDCMRIRMRQRAAKLAPSEESSLALQEDAQSLAKGSAEIQRVNGLLNVLEYVSGLTERKPTDQERHLMENMGAELLPGLEKARNEEIQAPDRINVEFVNLDNQIQQKFFSNPLAWNKGPESTPKDVASVQAVEGIIDRYAQATADRALSPLFDRMEKTFGHDDMRRADLITVDGRMVSDILEEKFREASKNGLLDHGVGKSDWMRENSIRMTNEIVAAGLMAGKRVEAFVPDKSGRIPQEPVQLTKTGYEPSPLKKVTLNAWERHFAKHGFYKEKAAKAAEYERIMESREKVHARNDALVSTLASGSAVSMKNFLFKGWMEEHGALPAKAVGDISATRGAYSTFMTAAMLREGYSIQDILNPDKLVQEREEMGRKTMEKLTVENDRQWAAETAFYGYQAMIKEADALGTFDLTDLNQLMAKDNSAFISVTQMMFDMGQEMEHFKPEIAALAEKDAPGRGREHYQEVFDRGDSIGSYMGVAQKAIQARDTFGDKARRKSALIEVANWEYSRNLLAEKRAQNPNASITQLVKTEDFVGMEFVLDGNRAFRDFDDRINNDKEFATGVRKSLYANKLGNYMKVGKRDFQKGTIEFEIDAKQVEKMAKAGSRANRLQEVADKNAQKAEQKEALQKKAPRKQEPKGPARGR